MSAPNNDDNDNNGDNNHAAAANVNLSPVQKAARRMGSSESISLVGANAASQQLTAATTHSNMSEHSSIAGHAAPSSSQHPSLLPQQYSPSPGHRQRQHFFPNNNNNNNSHHQQQQQPSASRQQFYQRQNLSFQSDDDYDDDITGTGEYDDQLLDDDDDEEQYEGHFQYISERLLVASQPPLPPPQLPSISLLDESLNQSLLSASPPQQQLPATTPYWTRVSRFLEERQFVWMALDDWNNDNLSSFTDPNEQATILAQLHGQVVHVPWHCASNHRISFSPTLPTLLKLCYMAQAWMTSAESTAVLVLACHNGHSKTALAAAAVLYWLGHVPTPRHGFCHFIACTRQYGQQHHRDDHLRRVSQFAVHSTVDKAVEAAVTPDAIYQALPFSVRNVLQQLYDVTKSKGHFPNPYPLRLKAISLQGVPVEDKPVLEVYDVQGRVIFSSHAHTAIVEPSENGGGDETAINPNNNNLPNVTSYWSDEEGLYRVDDDDDENNHEKRDVLLQGDFCLLARFGGAAHERDGATDPSKWLFRYIQSTAFCSDSGILELPLNRLDVMRRYQDVLDEVLVSLVVEPYWATNDSSSNNGKNDGGLSYSHRRPTPCTPSVLPQYYTGRDAIEEGWRCIAQYHACQPLPQHVETCRRSYGAELADCPLPVIRLALQLAHHQAHVAHSLLTVGCFQAFWASSNNNSAMMMSGLSSIPMTPPLPPTSLEWPPPPRPPWPKPLVWSTKDEPQTPDEAWSTALAVLDEVDLCGTGEKNARDSSDNNNKDATATTDFVDDEFAFFQTLADPFATTTTTKPAPPPLLQEPAATTSQQQQQSTTTSDDNDGGGGGGGGRANLMAAIAAKSAAAPPGPPKKNKESAAAGGGGDGRAGLMAAIAAKSAAAPAVPPKKESAVGGGDGRAGLMAAIAAKSAAAPAAPPKKESAVGGGDGRAGLMAAIAAKSAAAPAAVPKKESAVGGGDGRAGLMAAIAAKSAAAPAAPLKKESAADSGGGDGRAGLMAAIAAKSSATALPGPKKKESAGAAGGDGRAGLMTAIAAKGSSAAATETAPKKKESPAVGGDGRAGLMAAIAAKSSATAPPPKKKDFGGGGDGRAGLMAAIAAKGGTAESAETPKAAPGDGEDGRAGLMAAIATKSAAPAPKKISATSAPVDGRAGLMAAIAAKGDAAEGGGGAVSSTNKKPSSTSGGDGRSGLMAAIAAKGDAAATTVEKKPNTTSTSASGDGLMAAIAGKSASTENKKKVAENGAAGNGRAGLMAAIAAKGDAAAPKPPSTKSAPAGDGRSGLMAAIAAKGAAVETTTTDSAGDGRSGLMAAIAAKGASASTEKKANKDAGDGRSGLMAAIAAKGASTEKKSDDAGDGRSGLMAAIAAKGASNKPKKSDGSSGGRAGLMAAISAKGGSGAAAESAESSNGLDESPAAAAPTYVADDEPISVFASVTMSANVGDIYNSLVPLAAAGVYPAQAMEDDGQQQRPMLPLLPVGAQERHMPPIIGPVDDPRHREAVELLLQLQHLGVTLDDLTNLVQSTQKEWTLAPPPPVEEKADGGAAAAATGDAAPENSSTISNPNEAKDHPQTPKPAKDDGSPAEEEKKEDVAAAPKEEADDGGKPAMKNDERFKKYHKMRAVGLPDGAIANAMTRDEVDPAILDLDWDKNYEEQTQTTAAPAAGGGGGPPMKEDTRFAKYHKMRGVGLPDGAIANAMTRDGVDPSVLDLDWDKNYEEQTQPAGGAAGDAPSGPPMKEDERFAKYYKMKGVGLPDGAIANAMTRDGVDPSVLDLDWDKNYEAQTQPAAAAVPTGPPMKEDERFAKYWKMKGVGLPDGAIANAMARDGVDAKALDLDWDKNYEAQTQPAAGAAVPTGPPMKEDERFAKYWKMKGVGLPDGAIANAMARDGVDAKALDLDWDKNYEAQTQPAGGAVVADTGPPLKDDPEYEKYFKMLAVGLPPPAVQNAMSRDGKDPKILDLDPNKSVASQLNPGGAAGGGGGKKPMKKKKKVRRKKIYWTPIDPGQIKKDSLWANVKGRFSMGQLKYDAKEFADLFTESADPADKKKKAGGKKAGGAEKKEKKSQQVIDGKKSMNGGIILMRLRMAYNTIASMVDKMQMGSFDSTQLKALKEYLPTTDERKGLEAYMSKAGDSEEKKQQLFADLAETEKYMHTMMGVEKADKKFDCMIYRSQFQGRYDELIDAIKLIETAIDEVRNSEKLRHVMGLILVLVNEINTGGEDKGAAEGFSLEALLKLNEAKAFDKKTSVLQYLVKLVMKNDEDLLHFQSELAHSKHANNAILDSLVTDMKNLEKELDEVKPIAKEDAERAEQAGERSFSLQDLKEQKTSVHVSTSGVVNFNQINHHTGRTGMERFTLNATASIEQAIKLADHVQQKFVDLMEYFGEDEKMASDDFFKTMNQFIDEFEKARDQVEKAEKAREKAEKKEAARKKKEEEKRKKEEAAQAKANPKPATSEGDDGAAAAKASLLAALSFDEEEKPSTGGGDDEGGGKSALMAAIAAKGGTAKKKKSEGGGGRAGLLAAIAAKGDAEEAQDGGGDGRSNLMAAIAAKSSATKKDDKPSAGGDGRAGLMAAIAAKNSSTPAPKSNDSEDGGRSGLMAAIAAKGDKTAKKTSVSSEDGRSGLMAAIAAKGAGEKKSVSAEDGRSGLMAAIASKGAGEKKHVPAGDGRAGLLAAIENKNSANVSKSDSAGDGRAGLMDAIAKKGGSKVTKKPNGTSVGDGRAGLMAAIASKGDTPTSSETISGDTEQRKAFAAVEKNTSPADGGRSGLMAAIAAKGASSAPKKVAGSSTGGAQTADGRDGVMAADTSRKSQERSVSPGRDAFEGRHTGSAAKTNDTDQPASRGRVGSKTELQESGSQKRASSRGQVVIVNATDSKARLSSSSASAGRPVSQGRAGLKTVVESDEPPSPKRAASQGRAGLRPVIKEEPKETPPPERAASQGRAGLRPVIKEEPKETPPPERAASQGRAGLRPVIKEEPKETPLPERAASQGRAGLRPVIKEEPKETPAPERAASQGRARLRSVIKEPEETQAPSPEPTVSQGRAKLRPATESKLPTAPAKERAKLKPANAADSKQLSGSGHGRAGLRPVSELKERGSLGTNDSKESGSTRSASQGRAGLRPVSESKPVDPKLFPRSERAASQGRATLRPVLESKDTVPPRAASQGRAGLRPVNESSQGRAGLRPTNLPEQSAAQERPISQGRARLKPVSGSLQGNDSKPTVLDRSITEERVRAGAMADEKGKNDDDVWKREGGRLRRVGGDSANRRFGRGSNRNQSGPIREEKAGILCQDVTSSDFSSDMFASTDFESGEMRPEDFDDVGVYMQADYNSTKKKSNK